MRTALQALEGSKRQFIAVFEQYGSYIGNSVVGRTILLSSLADTRGMELAPHVWINYTAGFDAVGEFEKGEVVIFDAGVRGYLKGYRGEEIDKRLQSPPAMDYFLTFPRNVQKIGRRVCLCKSVDKTDSKWRGSRRGPTAPLKKHNGEISYLPEPGMKRRIVAGICLTG